MSLGLLILGTLFGFLGACIGLVTGQVGLLAAIGLYSAIGTLSILVGTLFIAMRPDDNDQTFVRKTVCTGTVAR
jgi:hypothetical protein